MPHTHSVANGRLIIVSADEPGDERRVLRRRDGEVVLDTLLRLGWTAPYACRRGGCGVCLIRLHRGRVRHGPHTERALSERAETDEGLALACRALPTTSVVEVEFRRGYAKQILPMSIFTPHQEKEQ